MTLLTSTIIIIIIITIPIIGIFFNLKKIFRLPIVSNQLNMKNTKNETPKKGIIRYQGQAAMPEICGD